MDPAIALLRDLVAINSVNPALVPGAPGEAQIASAIAEYLRRIGMDVELQEVSPGRSNVIGVIDGGMPGSSLMFCGHLDTVGTEGMTAPFDPIERNGRLYGRGAQDMKGGVAAMVDAARAVARQGLAAGRLLVAAVVDEEYASVGADALVRQWTADAAVVTEPTDLQVAVCHKGFTWCDVETKGRAAHGSRPADGRDAILRMGRVLHELERLDRDLQSRSPHPLMGTGSLHASFIHGGHELSSYPDRCALTIERRTLPSETETVVIGEITQLLEHLIAADPEFEASARVRFTRPAYELPAAHPLPVALQRALKSVGGGSQPVTGMSFWTDAAALAAAAIPSVLFGPGGAGLHSLEEYVEIGDVLRCRDALVALAQAWCTSEKKGA